MVALNRDVKDEWSTSDCGRRRGTMHIVQLTTVSIYHSVPEFADILQTALFLSFNNVYGSQS